MVEISKYKVREILKEDIGKPFGNPKNIQNNYKPLNENYLTKKNG